MPATSRSPRGRAGGALVAALALILLLPALPPAAAGNRPSVRLVRAAKSVTLDRYHGDSVPLDLGVFVAAVDGPFEIRLRRTSWYKDTLRVEQVDARGRRVRRIPADLLNGWHGLKDFVEVTFTDSRGRRAARVTMDFCPNAWDWDAQRLSDEGPPRTTYPPSCGSMWGFPFTEAMVWGIDAGWAVGATGSGGDFFDDGYAAGVNVPEGTYTVSVRLNPKHADLFGVPASGRQVTVQAKVRDIDDDPWWEDPIDVMLSGQGRAIAGPTRNVRTMSGPPAGGQLPDLAALPVWGIGIYQEGRKDLLGFASTPWNAGPGPFVLEGFRRSDADVMDAYQYFYDAAGKVQGRAPAGSLEYHGGGGHDHWHLLQFVRYDLLTRDGRKVVKSGKQGFCIAPTDPVSLTRKGASMRPWESYGGSFCGGSKSLWVREVLVAGWGDTYDQNVAGQAFDITKVPNGDYVIRMTVDPKGLLHQRTTNNDVSYRNVTLRGRAGARQVTVAPWRGIRG